MNNARDAIALAYGWYGGWAWMWTWLPFAFLLWLAVGACATWLLIRGLHPGGWRRDRAGEILAERYARGELTVEEYRERLEHLA
jgi:putative membrane protein